MQSTSPIWKWLWNEGGKNLPPLEYEGDIVSFDNPGYTYPKDITIGIEPVQSGSGDPSPTNVRPISGWTGARVTRTGKNLCSAVVRDGKYWATSNDGLLAVFNGLSAGTYTVSVINKIIAKEAETIAPTNRWIGIWPRNTGTTNQYLFDLRTILTAEQEIVGAEFTKVKTITITDEMVGKFNIVYTYAGDDKNYATSSFKIQIELGSTATDYEPYTGTTYDITFPSEAGTVYGGTLDVTTGLLTVTHGNIASYNGESLPGKWISSMDVYSAGGTPTTGVQLVYELATPQTYQLTPTEVKLMLGENNVWADTGDMTVALVSAGYTRLEARATVAGTVYTDISAPVIHRAAMSGGLAVGNVAAASLSLVVRGAQSIPRSAAVVIETRLNDGETASEWLPQGTFYISRRTRDPVTGLLTLACYDALLKANALWTPSAGAWPRTMAAVTAELAALLDVDLDSRTVIPTGEAYAISEPAEGTTIRDALSLVAQAAGGNWIMTPQGRLRLVRLGEAGDTVDVAGVVGGIDVGATGTITGVRSTVDGVATLAGDDTGIVVDVTLAPVIAAELAGSLIGQAWQPFHLTGAVYDPAAELGDAVRAGAGGEVASVLCGEQAAYGPAFRGDIAAPDPGEVTDEYPYIGSAERALALAKAAASEAVERYDDALTQQEIFNRLTDNGAAQGLVLYDGQLYVNATYIDAGELNAAIVRIKNLSVADISSGMIHSADYSTIVIPMLYPATDLYPAPDLYPNYGEQVTSGFAIDFRTGQIYGGFYSEQIATLQDAVLALQQAVTAMQSALVYPKALPVTSAMLAFAPLETQTDAQNNSGEDE